MPPLQPARSSYNRLKIAHHIVIRHSKYFQSLLLKKHRFLLILRQLFVVAHAIDFNNQRGTLTEEISDIRSNWMLSAKFQTGDAAVSQRPPQQFLRRRTIFPKRSRTIDHVLGRKPLLFHFRSLPAHSALTPDPSPKGRGEVASHPSPFGRGAGGEGEKPPSVCSFSASSSTSSRSVKSSSLIRDENALCSDSSFSAIHRYWAGHSSRLSKLTSFFDKPIQV